MAGVLPSDERTAPDGSAPRPSNGHANLSADALALAAVYRVFPLGLDKRPLTEHGFREATSDLARVAEWWREHPRALIGVAVPDNTIVVDLDTYKPEYRHGHGLHLPATTMQETRRSGWQLFYRTDRPARQTEGEAAPAVDTRVGGKGYVVAWQPEVLLASLPETWTMAPEWVYDRPPRTKPGSMAPAMETRSAILTWLGTIAGRTTVTAAEYLALLRQARTDGRIVARDSARPWTDEDIGKLAEEAAKWEPTEEGEFVEELEPTRGLQFIRLVDIEPRYAEALRCGRYDPVDHTVLFGDGGTGKGIVVAYDVARLTREGETVLIIDYERHADTEWRPRIEAAGGELDRVFIVQPDGPIWDVADEIVDGIAELSVTWAVLDSVAYACVGMEPEKSITAIRYSMAIARFPVPIISLAHTTKVDADPKHPFGSAFWSNGARITIGMSAPDEHTRLLKNRKTNQRAAFAPIEVDWSWSETEVLPPTLIEKRAVLTVADRAWDALARPLTSEALLLSVNADGAKPTTLGSLKVMLSRSRRFVSTPAGWQRAPSGLIFSANEGANGDSSETGSEGANGSANGNANRVLETANETANGTLTDRGVSSTPTLKGVTANGEPTRPLKLSIDPDLAFGPLGATGPDSSKATSK